MKHARTLAVAVAAATLSLGTGQVAQADKPGAEPCAKQVQQVTKAEASLAHVSAASVQHVKKDKKAQVQRLARAQKRLAACQAAHPA